jgi:DNA-binding transcriptional regulator YdaS (Cro superfamily)
MATVNTLEVKIVGDDSNLQSTLGGASLSVAKWGAAAVAAAAAATAALVRSGLQSVLTKQARQLVIWLAYLKDN